MINPSCSWDSVVRDMIYDKKAFLESQLRTDKHKKDIMSMYVLCSNDTHTMLSDDVNDMP